MTDLASNLQSVQARIAAAAARADRDPESVTLIAVGKTQPVEVLRAAHALGIRHLGENRVGEAQAKIGHLPADIDWHMVGHVQSRKAKLVVPLFQMVHSLDSEKLARRFERFCASQDRVLPVLLELNVSGETSKYGLPADRWQGDADQRQTILNLVQSVLELPHLRLEGLMTMAPIVAQPEQARPTFRQLRQIRDALRTEFPQLAIPHLSMGMTDDFEVAVEEGATLVRIGRAIFGPRMCT
jgi:pyridoxal phosphate enzyme (YggS family)